MKISNPVPGVIAIIASPFLFVELFITQKENSTMSGVYDLIYMAGWMCTILGLLRLQATGISRNSKMILYVQLALLSIANIWNVWTIIDPGNKSTLYFILDFFWPLSNICLLVTGIIVAKKGILKGWKRYVVLAAGAWLPFSILVMLVLGNTTTSLIVSGVYSTLGWAMMGYMILVSSKKNPADFAMANAA